MQKQTFINELYAEQEFFLMMVSLYHKFTFKDLKKYQSILKWGGQIEPLTKIGLQDPNYNFQTDFYYSLGLVFNQSINWTSKKMELYFNSDEINNNNRDNLNYLRFLDLIDYLPFTLYDLFLVELEIASKGVFKTIHAPYYGKKNFIDARFVKNKMRTHYPSINPFQSIPDILKKFNKQKLDIGKGLLINPQIWFKLYKKHLTRDTINVILNGILNDKAPQLLDSLPYDIPKS